MEKNPAHRSLSLQLEHLLEGDDELRHLEDFRAEAQRLAAGRLNIVVVGHFKRGKSSLLNALIGTPILPMGVVPVTALITLIRSGPEESAHVHYLDGRKEFIALSEIRKFVSEKSNPENFLGVERVDIEIPDLRLPPNVVLADTPGTGSVFQHNTAVLKQWLGHIDAALFVISAEPPVGRADIELLEEVQSYAGECRIVLNKIDRLQGEDLEEAIDYARKAVENTLNDEQELALCSARLALEGHQEESGIAPLRNWIEELAANRANSVLEKAAARRLSRIIVQEISLLKLEAAASGQSAKNLERAFETLSEIRLKMGARLEDAISIHRSRKQRLLSAFDSAAREAAPILKESLRERLEAFGRVAADRRIGGIRFLPELEKERDRVALEILRPFQDQRESELIESFSKLSEGVLEHINQLVDDAFIRAGNALGIKIEPFDIREGFRMESRLMYRVGLPKVNLDFFSEWILMLLPPPLARKALLRRQLNFLDDSIERQLGLIRADLAERLNESGISFEANIRRRVEEAGRLLLDALESGKNLLEAGRDRAAKRAQDLSKLEQKLLILREACFRILDQGRG